MLKMYIKTQRYILLVAKLAEPCYVIQIENCCELFSVLHIHVGSIQKTARWFHCLSEYCIFNIVYSKMSDTMVNDRSEIENVAYGRDCAQIQPSNNYQIVPRYLHIINAKITCLIIRNSLIGPKDWQFNYGLWYYRYMSIYRQSSFCPRFRSRSVRVLRFGKR